MVKKRGNRLGRQADVSKLPRGEHHGHVFHGHPDYPNPWHLPGVGLDLDRRKHQGVKAGLAQGWPSRRLSALVQIALYLSRVDRHGRKIPANQLPGTMRFDLSSGEANSRICVTDAITEESSATTSLPPCPVLTMRSPSGVTLP